MARAHSRSSAAIRCTNKTATRVVLRRGQYHYHSASDCMEEVGKGADGHSGLVGYALDGFGIYGSARAGGTHLSNGDLDACHGHVETVVWAGKATQMYHSHLTDEYPYTLGCFAGKPVQRSRLSAAKGRNMRRDWKLASRACKTPFRGRKDRLYAAL